MREQRPCAVGAFLSVRDREYDVEVVRVSDRARTRLTATPGYDGMYSWSPDGTELLFVSNRGREDALYLMRADGTGIRTIADTPTLDPAFTR